MLGSLSGVFPCVLKSCRAPFIKTLEKAKNRVSLHFVNVTFNKWSQLARRRQLRCHTLGEEVCRDSWNLGFPTIFLFLAKN